MTAGVRESVGTDDPSYNATGTVERLILAQATGAYGEKAPFEGLRPYASHVWCHTTGDTNARSVAYAPDGFPDVLFFEGKPWIYGPCVGPTIERVPSNFSVVGLALKPGLIPKWTGVSLSEVIGIRIPLAELLPKLAERVVNQIGDCKDATGIAARLQEAVLSDIRRVDAPDVVHTHIRQALDDRTTTSAKTSQIARALGTSERTLRRHCDSLFGYGPKTLERVLRLQRFLSRASVSSKSSLSALAYDAGFSDQAHLTREVRTLTGLTPKSILLQLSRTSNPIRHEGGAKRNENEDTDLDSE